MAAAFRIYAVVEPTKKARLVSAQNPSQAVAHVTKPVVAYVPNQEELVALVADGVEVEDIGEEVAS